jgi:hypothetical protein
MAGAVVLGTAADASADGALEGDGVGARLGEGDTSGEGESVADGLGDVTLPVPVWVTPILGVPPRTRL